MKGAPCQQLGLGVEPFPAHRSRPSQRLSGVLPRRARRQRGPSRPGGEREPQPLPASPLGRLRAALPGGPGGGAGPAPAGGFGSGRRGAMDSLWRLKRFDAFAKTLAAFRVQTCGGALGERAG